MDIISTLTAVQTEGAGFVQKYQLLLTVILLPTLLFIPKMFKWLNDHFKNLLFITIVIDQSDNMASSGFTNFNAWVSKRRIEWLSRTFEVVMNERWENGRRSRSFLLQTGTGLQVFSFKGAWFVTSMSRRETKANQNVLTGAYMITTPRWNRHLLELLVEESFQDPNAFEPVIIDGGNLVKLPNFYQTQHQLISDDSYFTMKEVFDRYLLGEEHYYNQERAYRETILLYGPPGTGKTNLVRHFASKYEMDVVVLKPGTLEKVHFRSGRTEAMNHRGAIYLIEDIDSNPAWCKDTKVDFSNGLIEVEGDFGNTVLVDRGDRGSLSELLNGLDGVQPLNRAIVIMSTNNPQKLHENIYREGRIETHIALEYLTPDETLKYLKWDPTDPRTKLLLDSEYCGKIPAAGILRLKESVSEEDVIASLNKTAIVKSLKNYQYAA